jgi:hypothetical protein
VKVTDNGWMICRRTARTGLASVRKGGFDEQTTDVKQAVVVKEVAENK